MERDEAGLVFPLLLHNFLLGMGIALLFTASSAEFIHTFDAKALALAFVVSGVVMLAVARIYAHLEHKHALERYLPAVVLALVAIVVLLRASGYFMDHAVTAFAMLVGYRIVYMLANLEFWGLSALVFDIRQSKRLFGLIGSGDIPAKMIGYLAVYLLSNRIHIEDMLYGSMIAFLLAYWMVLRVLRNPEALTRLHRHGHHHVHQGGHAPDKFLKRFFGSEFVMALAAFAFVGSLSMGLIDFSFYGKVKHEYHSSEQLAAFLGLFMTSAMVLTFVLKLLFSGRLLQQIGVAKVLLFLPVILLLPSIYLLLPLEMNAEQAVLLWFFMAIYLVRDVSKYALVDPMFLALFQPLNSHMRLRGHTIVKGLVDPLGLAVIGGLIYLGEALAESGMYRLLAFGLAVLCIGWIVAARWLNLEWLEMLRKSVRKRFLDGQSVSVGGMAAIELLQGRLQSGSAAEVIYALRMLRDHPQANYDRLLLEALSHVDPTVQRFALEELDVRHVAVPVNALELLIVQEHSPALQTRAAKLLLRAEQQHLRYAKLASHEDEALRKGAIAGMLLNTDPAARRQGDHRLHDLLESARPEDQVMGLWLLGETRYAGKETVVGRLMASDSALVVESAIKAAGKLGHPDLVGPLLELAQRPLHRASAMEALGHYEQSEISLHSLGDAAVLRTLCRLAAKPHSQIGTEFLLEQLASSDAGVRRLAVHALMKRGYKTLKNRLLQAHIADLQAHLSASMAQRQFFLATQEGKPLAAALETELHEMVDQLLICLSFIYDSRTIMRARHGLQFSNPELRAGAVEILDHLLPRGQAARLLPLLEALYLKRGQQAAAAPGPQSDLVDACSRLLQEASAVHDGWTVCLATDIYLRNQPAPQGDLVAAAMAAPTPFLAKYAHWLSDQYPNILQSTTMQGHTHSQEFSPLEMVLMLKASTIFAETPENTLAEVAAIAVVEHVAEGDILFKKGDTGDCMYIIVEGEILIGDGETRFATLGRSDFFGELALVETEPRSADAVAGSDCLLLRIDQDDFYELIEDRTEVARGILVILAQRLRRQNELIRKLKEGK